MKIITHLKKLLYIKVVLTEIIKMHTSRIIHTNTSKKKTSSTNIHPAARKSRLLIPKHRGGMSNQEVTYRTLARQLGIFREQQDIQVYDPNDKLVIDMYQLRAYIKSHRSILALDTDFIEYFIEYVFTLIDKSSYDIDEFNVMAKEVKTLIFRLDDPLFLLQSCTNKCDT